MKYLPILILTALLHTGVQAQENVSPSANIAFTQGIKDSLLYMTSDGQVVIGKVPVVNSNEYRLYVGTGILTEKLRVAYSGDKQNWADYVFDDDYNLPDLNKVSEYISINKHLPDVPPAKEVYANGIDVAEMNTLLLQKIEELTLYTIDQEKRIAELEKRLDK